MTGFLLPKHLAHLARKADAPSDFASSVAVVVTPQGCRLEVRVFDPRDKFKRQHAVSVDVDTQSPPKDGEQAASVAPPPA